jgi:hypothetical protein
MSQSYVSSAEYKTSAASTTRVVTEGGGWLTDDIILGVFSSGDQQSVTSVTIPTGWTLLGGGVSGLLQVAVGWVRWNASSKPSLTFTIGTASTRTPEAHLGAFRGCHVTSPIVNYDEGAFAIAGVGTNCDPPAVDAGTNGLVVTGAARALEYTTMAPPAGYTMRSNVAIQMTSGFASSSSDALLSGTQDPGGFTGQVSGSDTIWHGFSLALAPASGGGRVTKNRRNSDGSIGMFLGMQV